MATVAAEHTTKCRETVEFFWHNPEAFNRLVLRRPEPTDYQLEVWHSVRDNRHTNWRSGHMVGKDWTAAGILLWYLYCRAPAIVISTGPTNTQIEDVLWGEVRQAWKRSGLQGVLRSKPQRLQIDDDWYAIGFSTEDPEAMSGRHANDVLALVDEATGVKDPELWKALASQLNGAMARMLTLGNPLEPDGEFYQRHVRQHGNCIRTSSLDSPNVRGLTLEEILAGKDGAELVPGLATSHWIREEAAPQYVPGSNAWKARVEGEFPENAEDSTFLLQWIEESKNLLPNILERLKDRSFAGSLVSTRRITADIGEGHGGDETVVMVRDRLRILDCVADRRLGPMEAVAKILNMANQWKVASKNIVVDAVGIGFGTWQRLRELGVHVEAFKGGEAAKNRKRFENRRAESYWHLREALQPQAAERFCIGTDTVLRSDLLAQRHKTKSDRVIALEPKEKIKARLGRSPDRSDALAMSFAPSRRSTAVSVPMARW